MRNLARKIWALLLPLIGTASGALFLIAYGLTGKVQSGQIYLIVSCLILMFWINHRERSTAQSWRRLYETEKQKHLARWS